jgi:hypothetical protein
MSQEKASTREGDLLTPRAPKKSRGSSERRISPKRVVRKRSLEPYVSNARAIIIS